MKFPSLTLPKISEKRIAVHISAAAERAIRQGHPWLFESAITKESHKGKAGDIAVIFDKKRRFLAIGLYDPTSMIRVRIVRVLQQSALDENLFAEKLRAAHLLRAPLFSSTPPRLTNAYRLLHGENDGMPGIIIDRYAESFVIKLYTPAWIPHLNGIIAALLNMFTAERIILRLSSQTQDDALPVHDGMLLHGEMPKTPLIFHENGLKFEVDPINGQKTGFFLDQRENRARVEKLAKGKRVINAFSYTGGFSVYAARGGAKEVVSLDASKVAVEAAERNFGLNYPASTREASIHTSVAGDAFAVMSKMKQEGRRFEMVILDPPSFAHKKSQVEGAIKAYKKLTQLGLGILTPQGVLAQASCSSRVETELFFNAVHLAARQAGRPLEEIERTSHALDHPIAFAEGEYLKCLFAVAP